jgi:hypothetical protein
MTRSTVVIIALATFVASVFSISRDAYGADLSATGNTADALIQITDQTSGQTQVEIQAETQAENQAQTETQTESELLSEVDENAPSNRDKMRNGFSQLMDGLAGEMSPKVEAMRDWAATTGPAMQSFLSEMGPALADMMDDVKDWSRYELPEMQENGDIILRRKPDVDSGDTPDGPNAPDGADDGDPNTGVDL